jgi:hypothetical protein
MPTYIQHGGPVSAPWRVIRSNLGGVHWQPLDARSHMAFVTALMLVLIDMTSSLEENPPGASPTAPAAASPTVGATDGAAATAAVPVPTVVVTAAAAASPSTPAAGAAGPSPALTPRPGGLTRASSGSLAVMSHTALSRPSVVRAPPVAVAPQVALD